MAEHNGVVVKTADGGTYFIRDEILQMCRVADDELATVGTMLEEQESEVEGYGFTSFSSVDLLQSSSITASPKLYDAGQLADAIGSKTTVMCCW